MDDLSRVLESMRLTGSLLSRASFGSPWCVSTPGLSSGIFHAVVRGHCLVGLDDGSDSIELSEGDVALLPTGKGHVLSSEAGLDPTPIATLSAECADGQIPDLDLTGPGETTVIICGRVGFAGEALHPLLAQMPHLVRVRGRGDWIPATVKHLDAELRQRAPGSDAVVTRLVDGIVAQALRDFVAEASPAMAVGGLRDPAIRRVLGLIHQQPAKPWTVATLASKAAMSRTAFFNRFADLVGDPPARYLTRWRIYLAARALREEQLTIGEVASRVGYSSEAALGKAFKSLVGQSPGAYRDGGWSS